MGDGEEKRKERLAGFHTAGFPPYGRGGVELADENPKRLLCTEAAGNRRVIIVAPTSLVKHFSSSVRLRGCYLVRF